MVAINILSPLITPSPNLHRRQYDPTVGPLTTTFTPPAECSNGVITDVGSEAYFMNYVSSPDSSEGLSCFPEQAWSMTYYSPGLCQAGWTALPNPWDTSARLSLPPGETAAMCCPNGWSAYTSSVGCITQWENVSQLATYAIQTGTRTEPTMTTGTIDSRSIVYQYGISIRWREDDFRSTSSISSTSSQATRSTTTTAAAVTTSATISTLPSASSPTETQTSTSEGISKGAGAGIGVGTAAAVLLLVVAVWFWRRRRAKMNTPMYTHQPQDTLPNDEQRVLASVVSPAEPQVIHGTPVELSSTPELAEHPTLSSRAGPVRTFLF